MSVWCDLRLASPSQVSLLTQIALRENLSIRLAKSLSVSKLHGQPLLGPVRHFLTVAGDQSRLPSLPLGGPRPKRGD